MTSIQPISDEDEMIRRLMAAGATDDEIIQIVREEKAKRQPTPVASTPVSAPAPSTPKLSGFTRREALPDFGNLGQGFLEGAKDTAKRITGFIAQTGMQLNDPTAKVKTPELPAATTPSQAIGRFGGQVAAELPLQMATAGLVNPTVTKTATKLLGSTATKVAQKLASSQAVQDAVKVGITTIPQELIAGVITEGIVRPESFGTAQGALRTGILSSAGSLFNAGFAYRAAIKNAKSLSELAEIQKQIDAIGLPPDYLKDARSAELEAEIFYSNQANQPLYSASDLAMLRNGPEQTRGQLPSAYEAGWRRISQQLDEEAQLRAAQLQNVKPQQEVDVLAEAAAKRVEEPDVLVRAVVANTEEELKKIAAVESAGKGVQTNTVPDLGIQQTPNQFLTAAELQQHLDVLNMASVMGNPTFKKGQRWILPKTQLPTAEEIAARATGGPIRKIDKTIQQSMKDVQRRLDDAAAFRNGTLDPEEAQEIVQEMLTMSRRLSRGFEVPRTTAPRAVGPASEAALRNVEGWDLPALNRIDEPAFPAAAQDDTYKRWVTGSDNPDVPVPVAAVAEPTTVAYADAVRNANIDYTPQKIGFWSSVADLFKDAKQNFYDRTWGVGKYNEKARNLLQLLSGVSAYADEFATNQMRVAVRNPDGTLGQRIVQGRTLGQITRNLSDDQITEFDAYLKARTSLEQKNLTPGFKLDRPAEEFQSIVDNAPAEIKAMGEEFKVISDALVDDAVALGRLSVGSANKMKEKFYAGLSRVFNNATQQQALLKRTGSLRASQSPLRLMRDNIYTMLNKSRRNYAFSQLLEDYKQNPMKYNGVMEPVDVKDGLYGIPGYKEMVTELQDKAGMTLKDAEDMAGLMAPSLDKTDGSLVIYDQGKPTFWRVNDDIKRTVDALNPMEMGVFRALASSISRPTRMGVSFALDASGIGPISDMLLTTARVPEFIPIVDSVRGLFHSAFKTDAYQERLAAMGGYGTSYLKGEDVIPVGKGAAFIRRGGEIISSPFAMLQAIIRPLSDASRMGEYLVRRGRLGEDAMSAALASRNTLGDFNRVGAQLRGWSLVTEFGNVGIQSAAAAGQMAKDIAKAMKNGDQAPLQRALGTFVAGITMPTIYFWVASQGDKEIEALRKGKNGYRNWWIRAPYDIPDADIKQGEIIKVPKLGWWAGQMFGSSVEMLLDGMDKDAQKRFADGVLSQVGINMIPLTAQKLAGLATNTRNVDMSLLASSLMGDTSRRVPITPRGQEGLDPRIQGNERTTALGLAAGQAGFNPFMADYIMEGATGNLFTSAMRNAFDTKSALEKSDKPIFGRFFVSSKAPTEGSEMFYKDLEAAKNADKSFKKAASFGKIEEAQSILKEHQILIGMRPFLDQFSAKISELNSLMLTIMNDDTISAEGKRQYINNLRKAQSEMFMQYAAARKQMKQ